MDITSGIKQLEGTENIITSEDRARTALFSDPVTLNFKLLIDWNSSYGLFGTGINSAVGYFNRIGDVVRSELTQRFISEFQKFIQDYDFLILGVEGLQEIFNRNAWFVPNENEDKVVFTVRETIDLRVQALISMYNDIWWDSVRMVEVLPVNLRRFNCCVLVYSAGYFNNLLYGIQEQSNINEEPERWVLPTKRKLDLLRAAGESMTGEARFNHVRVNLIDAQIDTNESGKSFFSEISNEMNGDYVKNTLGIKYRFSNTHGLFTNVSGNKYITEMLIVMNEINKQQNTTGGSKKLFSKSFFKDYVSGLKDSFNAAAESQWNSIKTRGTAIANRHINVADTFIGNALNQFLDPSKVVGMVDSAVTAGVGILENRLIKNVVELENLVSKNFRPGILTDLVYDTFDNKKKPNITQLNDNLPKVGETPENNNLVGEQYTPESLPENLVRGISFKSDMNAFNRINRESF